MAKAPFSDKHLQINKANTTMIVVISIASIITAFSLVASNALLEKRSYQARVIAKKEKALNQLKTNYTNAQSLVESYKNFVQKNPNILGGPVDDAGDKGGDNARIILDALPSKYDFPAVASSLEKILKDNKFKIDSIAGKDDEVKQLEQDASGTPKPIEIPFEFELTTNYKDVPKLIKTLEKSIRPFSITLINLTGEDDELVVSVEGKTYYQPEKIFDVKKETVK